MNAVLKFGRTLSVLALAAAANSAVADEWPTFRGAGRTAVSPDKNLLDKWPTDGPPLVWKTVGAGRGYSSLAISGGKIYTYGDTLSTAPDTDEYLQCYDQKTGKVVWTHKVSPLWTGQKNVGWQSPRSTPTVDGDHIYAITPAGILVACKTSDGSEVFRVDLVEVYGGKKADSWGYSESPLVDGDKVVCTPGGSKTTMVAFDKKTGKEIWTNVREGDIGAGHASIVVSNVGGTKVYVQTTGSGAVGVRAEDGKVLWSQAIEKTTAVIPTPIVRDDLVFFTMGYGTGGGTLLKQVPQPGNEMKTEVLYPLNAKLKNKHGGVVLVGDYLYGDTDDKGLPWCAELMTGKIVWDKIRPSGKNSAAFAAADQHLYIHYANGTMVLAKADPAGYEEVGSFMAPGSGERPSWAHPVICDGMLYLRENDMILCYDVRAKGGASNAAGE